MTKAGKRSFWDVPITGYYCFVAAWRSLSKALSDDGADDMKAAFAVVMSELFACFIVYCVVLTQFKLTVHLPTWIAVAITVGLAAANYRLIFPSAQSRARAKRAEAHLQQLPPAKRYIVYFASWSIFLFSFAGALYAGYLVRPK